MHGKLCDWKMYFSERGCSRLLFSLPRQQCRPGFHDVPAGCSATTSVRAGVPRLQPGTARIGIERIRDKLCLSLNLDEVDVRKPSDVLFGVRWALQCARVTACTIAEVEWKGNCAAIQMSPT